LRLDIKYSSGILPPWRRHKEIKVRETAETDSKYGSKPDERDPAEHIRFGIIVLDKPAGPTSHDVVSWVKRLASIESAGHSGTLEVLGEIPL